MGVLKVPPVNMTKGIARRSCASLAETKGRVGGAEGAATRLGIKRTTLLTRMKRLGIDPRQFC